MHNKTHIGPTTEGVDMSSYTKPLFSAAILAIGLSVTGANAGILVKGTNADGVFGGLPVKPTFTIDTSDSPEIDVSRIAGLDFELNWDATALTFIPGDSNIKVNGNDYALSAFLNYLEGLDTANSDDVVEMPFEPANGVYRFSWTDISYLNSDPNFVPHLLDIGTSIESIIFTGAFRIEDSAEIDEPYEITFGTDPNQYKLEDFDLDDFYYSKASPPMSVTRRSDTPPTPAPEPGMLGLLLGGMVAYLGAVRLRRSGRG
jgi:hypothetical protein